MPVGAAIAVRTSTTEAPQPAAVAPRPSRLAAAVAAAAAPPQARANRSGEGTAGTAHAHHGEVPAGSAPPPVPRASVLRPVASVTVIPFSNAIGSFRFPSEPGPSISSGDGVDVDLDAATGSSTTGSDSVFSPSTYFDARTGLTPPPVQDEEPTSTAPSHEDTSNSPSPAVTMTRLLFEEPQGLPEGQEPAQAELEESGYEDEETLDGRSATFSDVTAEEDADPEASHDDDDDNDTAEDDAEEAEPEARHDDDAVEVEAEAEASDDASRASDSVEIQGEGQPKRSTRSSPRLAAARASATDSPANQEDSVSPNVLSLPDTASDLVDEATHASPSDSEGRSNKRKRESTSADGNTRRLRSASQGKPIRFYIAFPKGGMRDVTEHSIGSTVFVQLEEDFRGAWGTICGVKKVKGSKQYKVFFESSQEIGSFTANKIYSKEYLEETVATSHENLRRKACNECSQCMKDDCRRCQSCKANKSFPLVKRLCMHKLCSKPSDGEKAQLIPGFPPTVKGVVTEPELVPPECKPQKLEHRDLAGFYIISNKKQVFRGVEHFLTSTKKKLTPAAVKEVAAKTYDAVFSIRLDEKVKKHVYLGRKWSRSWIDSSLSVRRLGGTVTACYEPYLSDSWKFKVVFDDVSLRSDNKGLASYGDHTPKSMTMSQKDTELGLGLLPGTKLGRSLHPGFERWIIPYEVSDEVNRHGCPIRTIKVKVNEKDFELKLQVQASEIAGWGVFVSTNRKLVLGNDEYIDMGVYAPLRHDQFKPDSAVIIKNIVKGSKCADYGFGCDCRPGFTFDVTNDGSGDLCDEARQCVLTFVNEVDGGQEKQASVAMRSDPTGAVHFLLGNAEGLQFDRRKKTEVKADYGDAYEKSRVRNKYPRVKGKTLKAFKQTIESESFDSLLDVMKFWDFVDLQHGIDQCYLSCKGAGGAIDLTSLPQAQREPLFSATLALHTRLREFEASASFIAEFGSQVDVSSEVSKSTCLMSSFLHLYNELSYEPLLNHTLSRQVIQHVLGADGNLSASDLKAQLSSLLSG